jgi:hypothetical protein
MSDTAPGPPLAPGSVNTSGGCSERRHCRACGGRGADVRRGNQRSAGEAGALGLPAPCRRLMSRSTPALCPAMASTGCCAGRAKDATHSTDTVNASHAATWSSVGRRAVERATRIAIFPAAARPAVWGAGSQQGGLFRCLLSAAASRPLQGRSSGEIGSASAERHLGDDS